MQREVGPYECLGMVGEGTYGVVIKARHRTTGLLVAIKEMKRVKGDCHAKKVATREVRLLRQLRHPNIVRLIEVIRDASEGSFHLVFEYVERTVLQCLEVTERGVDPQLIRRYMYQLLRCLEYCHASNVIHRDVKPENILISSEDIVKLCDFGFARLMLSPDSFLSGSKYTDYVATRWYRAPELLVGKTDYNTAVDVWAVGCVFAELTTKEPLFPGKTDADQLSRIVACCGALPPELVACFQRNPLCAKARLPAPSSPERRNHPYQRFRDQSPEWLAFLTSCLQVDPEKRRTCSELLASRYFTHDYFHLEMDEILKRSDLYMPAPSSSCSAAVKKARKIAATARDNRTTTTRAAFLAEGGVERGPTLSFRSPPRYPLLPLLALSKRQGRANEGGNVVEERAKADGEASKETTIQRSEWQEGKRQGPYFLRLPRMKPYFSSVGTTQPHRQVTFRRMVPGGFTDGFHPTTSSSTSLASPSSMPRTSSPPFAGSSLLPLVHQGPTQREHTPVRRDSSDPHGVAVSCRMPQAPPQMTLPTREEEVEVVARKREEHRRKGEREVSEMVASDRRGSSPFVERQTLPTKKTEIHPHDGQYLPYPPPLYRQRHQPVRLLGPRKRYQLSYRSSPGDNSGIAFASAPVCLPAVGGERSLFSKRHL